MVAVDRQRELPKPPLQRKSRAQRLVINADPATVSLSAGQPLLPPARRLSHVVQQAQPQATWSPPNGRANPAANSAVPRR